MTKFRKNGTVKQSIFKMKVLLISVGAIVGVLLMVEVSLRLLFGLGHRPLYIADPDIGYLLSPNQNLRRFGKRMLINQYSMRSEKIEKHREPKTLRILLIGDSIANGAWWTDQQGTISALMTKTLEKIVSQNVEVLNASANSWAPRNQLAYLQKFGTFEAQIIILLMNTDDFFGTAPTSLVVGKEQNYPDRQPTSAIGEIFERLFYRPQPIPGMSAVVKEKGDRVGFNLQREVTTEPRDYEKRARQRLQAWVKENGVGFLDFLPIFQQQANPEALYRDHIHLSPGGNQLVSERISQLIPPVEEQGIE